MFRFLLFAPSIPYSIIVNESYPTQMRGLTLVPVFKSDPHLGCRTHYCLARLLGQNPDYYNNQPPQNPGFRELYQVILDFLLQKKFAKPKLSKLNKPSQNQKVQSVKQTQIYLQNRVVCEHKCFQFIFFVRFAGKYFIYKGTTFFFQLLFSQTINSSFSFLYATQRQLLSSLIGKIVISATHFIYMN